MWFKKSCKDFVDVVDIIDDILDESKTSINSSLFFENNKSRKNSLKERSKLRNSKPFIPLNSKKK